MVGPAAERTQRSRLCQLLGVSVVATSISQQDTSHTRVIWSCSCIQMCWSQHVCRWLQQVYQSVYSEAFCSVWQQSWWDESESHRTKNKKKPGGKRLKSCHTEGGAGCGDNSVWLCLHRKLLSHGAVCSYKHVEDCSVDAWVKVLHQRIHRNCCYFKWFGQFSSSFLLKF